MYSLLFVVDSALVFHLPACDSKFAPPVSTSVAAGRIDAHDIVLNGQDEPSASGDSAVDAALIATLEALRQKNLFVPFGPAIVVDVGKSFTVVKRFALQGQGQCYLALTVCKGAKSDIRLRLRGGENGIAPFMPYRGDSTGARAVRGILACPEKSGLYALEAMTEGEGDRCAFGLLGN